MNKLLAMVFFHACILWTTVAAQDIVGFWRSVDEKTGKRQSVVGIYEYKGKYYGRMIVTFNEDGSFNDTIDAPVERAPGVKGEPYYAGLDFIWGLKKNGQKYTDGFIMDPKEGKVYDSELWNKDGNLVVRGQIWIFGRNQTWPPASESDFPPNFKKPDLKTMVPKILDVKS